ncbi:MAG TPA: sulfotransferase [Solirubrobacteraceae bacterium]|nr:sulfotransferase [Solirubrobacteraceae bacterium]
MRSRAERGTAARPRVLYVMGAGRSGSTTLGITLGNCEGVFFAGELDNWLARSGVPQVEDEDRLRFWAEVRVALDDPEMAEQMYGNEAQCAIERSMSLLRVRKWPLRRRLGRRYRAVAEDLYCAVSRASGDGTIADTSHYPLRARQLQRLDGIDLYLIFLVRDPQGVVASFNRQDVGEFTKSTLHTNVYLWVTHLLSLVTFLRHPRDRRVLLRYEDFVADPASTIDQLMTLAGSPETAMPDFSSLRIGLPLQGNRVTRSAVLSLKPGTDPVRNASLLTSLLQAPLKLALRRLRPAVARSALDAG